VAIAPGSVVAGARGADTGVVVVSHTSVAVGVAEVGVATGISKSVGESGTDTGTLTVLRRT